MSMQVKAIALYSRSGERRDLVFRLGAVNIVTGKSRTGKSAIIDIIDYCLARSTFTVFEGVNRESVAWYAVMLRVNESDVFIAKPAPEGAAVSQSRVHYRVGPALTVPAMSELDANTNDEGLAEVLSGLLGIGSNVTLVGDMRTMTPFAANVAHAKYYLFQEQGVVANRQTLFHRQAEPFIEQHIKDTLPYFLGAVREDFLKLQQQLREAKRELARGQRALTEAEAISATHSERALSLVAEAQNVGLVRDVAAPTTAVEALQLLKPVDQWQPASLDPQAIDARVEQLNRDLADARRRVKEVRDRIREAEAFAAEAEGFKAEAGHQVARLSALNVFDQEGDHSSCPLCSSQLSSPVPAVADMEKAIAALASGLSQVERERPRVRHHIAALVDKESELRDEVRRIETLLNASQREIDRGRRLGDAFARASRVAGRVSLFLESVQESNPGASLRSHVEQLQAKVLRLEQQLGVDEVGDVVTSALSVVGKRMTEFAEMLDLEHRGNPYRLDLKHVTVVADAPGRPIPMSRMGSGENWLGCHLLTLVALHEYFVLNSRPVPGFLVLDQPSQVYFPSQAYRALSGSVEDTALVDVDVAAVTRMFDFLFDACERLAPNFQVIVTEHANLPDARFQAALVEAPWHDGKALVPSEWLSDAAPKGQR